MNPLEDSISEIGPIGIENSLQTILERELADEYRSVLKTVSLWLILPINLLFWIPDIIFYPELKWKFLGIRLLTIPLVIPTVFFTRQKSSRELEMLASFLTIGFAFLINLMIVLAGHSLSIYYPALLIIALGGVTLFPFSNKRFAITLLGIYLPYCCFAFSGPYGVDDLKNAVVQTCLIATTVGLSFVIRFFNERRRTRELKTRITYSRAMYERRSSEERFLIARQVAHDIRSPLSALRILSAKITSDVNPDIVKLLAATTERIDQVANDLLQRSGSQQEGAVIVEPKLVEIDKLISQIMYEKNADVRISSGQVRLRFENLGSSAVGWCVASQLERIISNVINNSIEAIEVSGSVIVRLTTVESAIIVSIADTGKGIPSSIVNKLGHQMLSFGKPSSGHGIALWSARQWIEAWGGSLNIVSKEGTGTEVRITLSNERRLPGAVRDSVL